MTQDELDQLCVNTIRFLAVDTVQNANSGHPGMPLDAAPMAYVLATRFVRQNPADPSFIDRDRFVLSSGHASALLYATMHLTGYAEMTIEQLKRFRQWHSLTPGHPESHLTHGVEASTGPLENRRGPTVLVLSRQHVPTLDRRDLTPAEELRRDAYVLNRDVDDPDLILIATGSEVSLIVAAERALRQRGVRVRMVSMPSWEIFERQSAEYRESVLPRHVKRRLAVEAACSLGWHRWVGAEGDILAVDRFGASAPGGVLMKEYGLTAEHVVSRALALPGTQP